MAVTWCCWRGVRFCRIWFPYRIKHLYSTVFQHVFGVLLRCPLQFNSVSKPKVAKRSSSNGRWSAKVFYIIFSGIYKTALDITDILAVLPLSFESNLRHFHLIQMHWLTSRDHTMTIISISQMSTTNSLQLNICSVVLQWSETYFFLFQDLFCLVFAIMLRITRSITLVGRRRRLIIPLFWQSRVLPFFWRGIISGCVQSLGHCPLIQIFWHTTVKALMTPGPPGFRILAWMLSTPGESLL